MSTRAVVLVLAAIVALGAAVRGAGLGREPLWIDEMKTVRQAGVDFPGRGSWGVGQLVEVTQGPLFMLAVHGWSMLAGRSEASLRLLPCLFGIVSLPLLWLIARRYLSTTGALTAVLLMALCPFHVWYSRELRGYSMVIAAALLSTWVLERIHDRLADGRSVGWSLGGYVASVVVGLGASFTMVFMLAVHGVLYATRRRRADRGTAVVVGVVLLLVLLAGPWVRAVSTRADLGRLVGRPRVVEGPLRGETTFPLEAIPYTFFAWSVGFSLGPNLEELNLETPGRLFERHAVPVAAVALVFGGLAVTGLIHTWRRTPGRGWQLVCWIVLPLGLLAVLAAANVKVWNPRYVAVSAPAFLLLTAIGISATPVRLRVVALALPLCLSALGVWNLHTNPHYWKEDLRATGAYLDRHLEEGDAVVSAGSVEAIFYYLNTRPSWNAIDARRLATQALTERLQAATGGARRVWLVRSRAWRADPDNRVGGWLAGERPRAPRVAFRGVDLDLFGPAGCATIDCE